MTLSQYLEQENLLNNVIVNVHKQLTVYGRHYNIKTDRLYISSLFEWSLDESIEWSNINNATISTEKDLNFFNKLSLPQIESILHCNTLKEIVYILNKPPYNLTPTI